MTRTHKWTYHESKADPHFFSHNGHANQDPTKTKKNGAGKGNWGTPGDEIADLIESGEISPIFNKTRRGSNSSQHEQRLGVVQRYDEWIKEEEKEAEDDDTSSTTSSSTNSTSNTSENK